MRFKSEKLICFGIGAILGALIWFLSPVLTGHAEPWDGGAYYWVALFFAGLIGYAVYPRSILMTIIGIYIGQLLALLIVGMGPLFLVGTVLLAVYSLVALSGAWVVKLVRNASYSGS